ncbi:MAG: hypothetical protein GY754_33685 [bacterium]|nr:hypothetical protein [bacterium]
MDTIKYEYIFTFKNEEACNSKSIDFIMEIDRTSRQIVKTNIEQHCLEIGFDVHWTELTFHQCEHCPLDVKQFPRCPIAVNLYQVISIFGDHSSIEEVDIEVRSPERNYLKRTRLQYGLQSLFGILMPASGCPRMNFLSPLVPFHLPFADVEETIVRVTSIYLLSQFFHQLDDEPSDFTMEGLRKKYEEVSNVNQGILNRIRSIEKSGDATENAITILNAFVLFFSYEFRFEMKRYRYLFQNTPQ